MFKKLCFTLCAYLLTQATFTTLQGQCLVAPPAPAACTGAEPLVADGNTLNTATTKWFYGATPTTYNTLTMNGGTLIVCGNLLVDKFYFHSGTIYIRPGGRFAIGTGIGTDMEGDCAIYNYGTLDMYRSIGMKNMHANLPNIIINALASSVFNVNNNYLVMDNPYSWFVNNGNANFHGLVLDPGCAAGAICMANNSQFHIDHLVNKTFNTFNVPSGGACFTVTQLSQFCQQLTNNPNVYACIGSSHTTDSSCLVAGGKHNPWGSAQTFVACPSCASVTILPVHYSSFTVTTYRQAYLLKWRATGYPANNLFRVERSADGIHFTTVATTAINESSAGSFDCYDNKPLPGRNYYRIAATNAVSRVGNNSMIVMGKIIAGSFLPVYPNPFSSHFYVSLNGEDALTSLLLTNTSGQVVRTNYSNNNGTLEVFVTQKITPGIYTLRVTTAKTVYQQKIIQQ
jgi:hypothetical protein